MPELFGLRVRAVLDVPRLADLVTALTALHVGVSAPSSARRPLNIRPLRDRVPYEQPAVEPPHTASAKRAVIPSARIYSAARGSVEHVFCLLSILLGAVHSYAFLAGQKKKKRIEKEPR